jgi:hypothetical protein
VNEQIGSLIGAAVDAVTTDVRFFTVAMLGGFVAVGCGFAWADRRWKQRDRGRLPFEQAAYDTQRGRREGYVR